MILNITQKAHQTIRSALNAAIMAHGNLAKLTDKDASAYVLAYQDALDEISDTHKPTDSDLDEMGFHTLRQRYGELRAAEIAMRSAKEPYMYKYNSRIKAMMNRPICPICDDYSGNCEHRGLSLAEWARAYNDRPVSAEASA